ncbi:MAG: hypothetical protein ABFS45_24320 [Pseudomonadota bacterium]
MGRRCKLTPEAQRRVAECLRLGAGRATAAAAAGIGESTLYRWLERGEASTRGQFREFWEAVRGAEYEAELSALRHWQAAMPKDWRACKEFLERRFPERWSLRQDRAGEQPPHQVFIVKEDQFSVEEWEQMVISQSQE